MLEYNSFTYSSKDQDAGTWTSIYLTSASQVAVAAPTDPTSSEYLSELAALKSLSASLSSDQEKKSKVLGNQRSNQME